MAPSLQAASFLFNPIGNVKGVQWTTRLTKYQPSVYLAAQHFSFTPLSAALRQQRCVYGIYMPVCVRAPVEKHFWILMAGYSGAARVLTLKTEAWWGALEKRGPKNKSAAPRRRRRHVFFSTIMEHRKYGVILQQARTLKRLIVVECKIHHSHSGIVAQVWLSVGEGVREVKTKKHNE